MRWKASWLPLLHLPFILACGTIRDRVAPSEQYLHTQPTVVAPQKRNATFTVDTSVGKIAFRCVQDRFPDSGIATGAVGGEARTNECLYLSADAETVLNLPVKTETDRNNVVLTLITASDTNCSNYLFRVFATKAGLDTARNTLKDVATGLAAGTAHALPAISSGLGFANLFVGTAIDNVNTTYYFEKTFQAVEAAILEQRLKQRTAIQNRRSDPLSKYAYLEAIADVRVYDDACSLQRGLARLVELTGEQKEQAKNALQQVDHPESSIQFQIGELQSQVREFTARGLKVDELQKKIDALQQEKNAAKQKALDTELEQLKKQKEIDELRKQMEPKPQAQPPHEQPPSPPAATPAPPSSGNGPNKAEAATPPVTQPTTAAQPKKP